MEFIHFDLAQIIKTVGYLGLFLIIFSESGLLVGVFLPGDSILFTAGVLASQGFLNIYSLTVILFLAAAAGDSVGYTFGSKIGPKIFTKKDSIFFHKNHLERTRDFFEKHGGKTVTIARFVPVIRTFAPIIAGVGQMKYSKFLGYNLLGAFLWAVMIPVIGYYLGTKIPSIDRYLLPIVTVIILVSISPTLYHLLKQKKDRRLLLEFVKTKVFKR